MKKTTIFFLVVFFVALEAKNASALEQYFTDDPTSTLLILGYTKEASRDLVDRANTTSSKNEVLFNDTLYELSKSWDWKIFPVGLIKVRSLSVFTEDNVNFDIKYEYSEEKNFIVESIGLLIVLAIITGIPYLIFSNSGQNKKTILTIVMVMLFCPILTTMFFYWTPSGVYLNTTQDVLEIYFFYLVSTTILLIILVAVLNPEIYKRLSGIFIDDNEWFDRKKYVEHDRDNS